MHEVKNDVLKSIPFVKSFESLKYSHYIKIILVVFVVRICIVCLFLVFVICVCIHFEGRLIMPTKVHIYLLLINTIYSCRWVLFIKISFMPCMYILVENVRDNIRRLL